MKNKKKTILAIIIIVVTNLISFFIGRYEVVFGYTTKGKPTAWAIDRAKALDHNRQEVLLWRDICHEYWEFCDMELDSNGYVLNRHAFWDDCVMGADSYQKLDSLLQGDWEDFFYDWYVE